MKTKLLLLSAILRLGASSYGQLNEAESCIDST